jgi:hypothetical protein
MRFANKEHRLGTHPAQVRDGCAIERTAVFQPIAIDSPTDPAEGWFPRIASVYQLISSSSLSSSSSSSSTRHSLIPGTRFELYVRAPAVLIPCQPRPAAAIRGRFDGCRPYSIRSSPCACAHERATSRRVLNLDSHALSFP